MIFAQHVCLHFVQAVRKRSFLQFVAVFALMATLGITAPGVKAQDQGRLDSILDQITDGRNASPVAGLTLQSGFARGGVALYITPEVGVDPSAGADVVATAQSIAKAFNANFIPTNFAALPGSPAVRNIFVFSTQGNVLSATPIPAGPTNTNTNYSPLWQVNLVAFTGAPTLLTSTADITAAQAAGTITVTPTPIIVECSVILALAPGGQLPDSRIRLEAPSAAVGGSVTSRVRLPLQVGFYNRQTALYITPEVGVDPTAGGGAYVATAQSIAKGFNANYIPQNFASLPNSSVVDDIFVFTNFTQGNVLASAPIPAGPTNTDTDYSPIWQISLVAWNSGFRPRPLTSQADILQAASRSEITITKTPIIVECSVIFTPQGGLLPTANISIGDEDQNGNQNRQ